jgi:hypothetical protein
VSLLGCLKVAELLVNGAATEEGKVRYKAVLDSLMGIVRAGANAPLASPREVRIAVQAIEHLAAPTAVYHGEKVGDM